MAGHECRFFSEPCGQMLVFRQQTLLGSVQTAGNLCFSPDGETLYTAAGTRLLATNLKTRTTRTLPTQTFTPITRVAADPRGAVVLLVDSESKALLVSAATHVLLATLNLRDDVASVEFSPTRPLLAIGFARRVEVWQLPDVRTAADYEPALVYRRSSPTASR